MTTPEPHHPRPGRALGWALGAVVVAVVIGVVVGVVAALVLTALVPSDGSDGWGDVIAAVLGVLVGVGAAVLAWVIGLAVVARRFFPKGSRLVAVVLSLGAAALGSAAVIALLNAAGVSGGPVTGNETRLLVVIAVIALSTAVFPWWDRRLARR